MRRFLIFLVVAPAVLVGVIVAGMLAGGAGSATRQQAPQRLTMVMREQAGQRGPFNMAVQPDRPVVLTIVNYEPKTHTFSIPELGVNQIVPPALNGKATRVTVSFTAPFGVYHWVCGACYDDFGNVYSVVTSRGSAGYPPGGFHWAPSV